jgi:hypothetical protein
MEKFQGYPGVGFFLELKRATQRLSIQYRDANCLSCYPARTVRGLVYGFARMNIDGHFPRWGIAETEAERTAESILDLFIDGIATRQQSP